MLATNFGSLCPEVTNFGSQHFGYQIWFCTRLLISHWGRVTHICVSDLTSIGSDNGLSPGRRQAVIRTNAGLLLIKPLGTNFSEMLIIIQTFSLKKIRLKMSSAKCCSFRLSLNVICSCATCIHQWNGSSLVKVMAHHLFYMLNLVEF